MPRENPDDVVVAAIGEPGRARAPRSTASPASRPYSCAKNVEVLPGRQLGIEVQLVREQADATAAAPAPSARAVLPPYVTLPARRRDQRGEHADERGLAGAVRAEQTDDFAARGR